MFRATYDSSSQSDRPERYCATLRTAPIAMTLQTNQPATSRL
jgi:hypothetical protein